MKKILLSCFVLLGMISTWSTFAEQLSGAGTLSTITTFINSMADNGLIDADVAKYKIGYYSDQIFINNIPLTAVMTGSEDWARTELSTRISKKLYNLKDQGYISKEKYDELVTKYTNITSTGSAMGFGQVYKDFLVVEKDLQENEITRTQTALFNTYKEKLGELLKARRITQEKYNAWLDKIQKQVYQYKSDPTMMATDFDEEAARNTAILPCTPCATDCTPAVECPNPTSVSPEIAKLVQVQYGKVYSKMSLKSLQLALSRTKMLEKKYVKTSTTKLRLQAQIALLNQEIAKRNTTTTAQK